MIKHRLITVFTSELYQNQNTSAFFCSLHLQKNRGTEIPESFSAITELQQCEHTGPKHLKSTVQPNIDFKVHQE